MKTQKLIFKLLTLLLPVTSVAQNHGASGNTFSFSPAFELLRSTHGNAFYAPSLKVNYHFDSPFEVGIGTEYSTTPLHHDNGFLLYKVKFVPVYGNVKYTFPSDRQVKFYAETSLGISFNKYDIADERTPTATSKVAEEGFYVYSGFGAKYGISKNISTFLTAGFKGYKMSTNDLDINPHGLSFAVGFTFL